MNDPNFDSYWDTWLNAALREFARLHPWPGLEDTLTVTTDGTAFITLPPYVDTVLSILNTTANIPVDRSGSWERESPSAYAQRTTGTVLNYDQLGVVPVLRAPSGYLWFQSTHASDTQTLYVTGTVNNSGASGTGLQSTVKNLSVSAAGTSPVTLSSLFTNILSISKATHANGDFFFMDAGAANAHISFLGQYEDEARFKRIQLLYAPAAQTLLRVKFRYKVPELQNDAQSPHPAVKADFLVEKALSFYHENRQSFTKSNVLGQKALQVISQEADKDANFDEPYQQIVPMIDWGQDSDYPLYPTV